ncbi:unnamed protein product [Dovyalis caffra]|uniref:Uncharacterized protein n=1 Tax=Dovyalis caffra TaxID=77055 RepID=A0AAV1S4Y9_9ROSI|nr:unnamed protein product [Dovyalis caffra]
MLLCRTNWFANTLAPNTNVPIIVIMVLVAMGTASKNPPLKAFLSHQLVEHKTYVYKDDCQAAAGVKHKRWELIISSFGLASAFTTLKTQLEALLPLWLDKAAILDSSLLLEEQVQGGRLCSARDVKRVKQLFTLIPLWTTLLGFGLVLATGSTFFVKQSDKLDEVVPINAFFLVQDPVTPKCEWKGMVNKASIERSSGVE